MNRFRSLLPAILAYLLLPAGTAHAWYIFTTLASFDYTNGSPSPYSGLTFSGTTIYGTTGGGANGCGTVFSVPITGGTPTVLASFNGSNGNAPSGGLILSGNTLYGTTQWGGTGYTGGAFTGGGTVFSVPISGGATTVLTSFNGANGQWPCAGLTLVGNTLYGTTSEGGANNYGTIFSIPISGGTPTVLTSFNLTDGAGPEAGLTLSGNILYGTTMGGGANGYGTVFSVPITGGTPTVLASFNASVNTWACPEGGLVRVGNALYGTTADGGAYNDGTVFSVPITGGTPTILASFYGPNGASPQAGLTLVGNTLCGTTYYGGDGYTGIPGTGTGTVFSVPITGGTPTVLASLSGYPIGQSPEAGLTLSGNALYGTTGGGGSHDRGSVFALTPYPIIGLTVTAPAGFGLQVGTLAVVGGNGKYNVATAAFAATPDGCVAVSGFNPPSDTENYALHITDSVPANLAADLADAASEINAFTYTGYSLTASTTDPTGNFGGNYNFFLTITGSTLGSSPYMGFDFLQLNGTADTLSVDCVAVPEPGCASLLLLGGLALRLRSRASRRQVKVTPRKATPSQAPAPA